jgi:hypothetical protein
MVNKKDKKNEGIFLPKDAYKIFFSFIKELDFFPKLILEPSFCSSEFISDL